MPNGQYSSYKGRGRSTISRRRRGTYRTYDAASREARAQHMQTSLVVCLFIAALFFIAKLIFPSAFSSARDSVRGFIETDVDLKSVAYVIGEAINGEKSVSEAFSEACGYAFGIENDGSAQSDAVDDEALNNVATQNA